MFFLLTIIFKSFICIFKGENIYKANLYLEIINAQDKPVGQALIIEIIRN